MVFLHGRLAIGPLLVAIVNAAATPARPHMPPVLSVLTHVADPYNGNSTFMHYYNYALQMEAKVSSLLLCGASRPLA